MASDHLKTSISPFPFQAGGHTLYGQWINQAESLKQALVFLHEGLGSIAQWKTFPATLCEDTGRTGFVYERYGFGQSDALQEARTVSYLEDEAHTLLAVLDAVGLTDPVTLVGHSDGGSIALVFAACYPDRVEKVITEAAHVFVEEVTLAGIREAKQFYESSSLLHDKLARYHGEHTESTFYGWNATWLLPPFAEWNIEAYLPRIQCPLLVIQGEDDEYGTLAQVDAITDQSSGPAIAFTPADCGHAPHHQQPQAVLEAMTAFLR